MIFENTTVCCGSLLQEVDGVPPHPSSPSSPPAAAAAAAAVRTPAAGRAAGGRVVGRRDDPAWRRTARSSDRVQPAGRRLAASPGGRATPRRRQPAPGAVRPRGRVLRAQRAAEALSRGRRRRQLPVPRHQLVDHRLRATARRGTALHVLRLAACTGRYDYRAYRLAGLLRTERTGREGTWPKRMEVPSP